MPNNKIKESDSISVSFGNVAKRCGKPAGESHALVVVSVRGDNPGFSPNQFRAWGSEALEQFRKVTFLLVDEPQKFNLNAEKGLALEYADELQHEAIALGNEWFTANCPTFLRQDVVERLSKTLQVECQAESVLTNFKERQLSVDDQIGMINSHTAEKFKIIRWQQMLECNCNSSEGKTSLASMQNEILKNYDSHKGYSNNLLGATEKHLKRVIQKLSQGVNSDLSSEERDLRKSKVTNLKKSAGKENTAAFMRAEAGLFAAIAFIEGAEAIDMMLYPGCLPIPIDDAMQLVTVKFQIPATPLINVELKSGAPKSASKKIESSKPNSSPILSGSPASSVGSPVLPSDDPLLAMTFFLQHAGNQFSPEWCAIFAARYVHEYNMLRTSPPNSPPGIHSGHFIPQQPNIASGIAQFGTLAQPKKLDLADTEVVTVNQQIQNDQQDGKEAQQVQEVGL